MNHTYPNPLHDGTPNTFDTYEVNKVGRFVGKAGLTFVEPLFTDEQKPIHTFYTIYGHTDGEGVEALVDVDTEEQALDTLRRMGVLK